MTHDFGNPPSPGPNNCAGATEGSATPDAANSPAMRSQPARKWSNAAVSTCGLCPPKGVWPQKKRRHLGMVGKTATLWQLRGKNMWFYGSSREKNPLFHDISLAVCWLEPNTLALIVKCEWMWPSLKPLKSKRNACCKAWICMALPVLRVDASRFPRGSLAQHMEHHFSTCVCHSCFRWVFPSKDSLASY